jgi:phage-related protein
MSDSGRTWIIEHLDDTVDQEFAALPKDIQAKFLHLAALIEEVGLPTLREPYVKHVEGKLWELRVKAKSGLGRGLYCTIAGKRIIVFRYFKKTSTKIPSREIAVALQRMLNIFPQT